MWRLVAIGAVWLYSDFVADLVTALWLANNPVAAGYVLSWALIAPHILAKAIEHGRHF